MDLGLVGFRFISTSLCRKEHACKEDYTDFSTKILIYSLLLLYKIFIFWVGPNNFFEVRLSRNLHLASFKAHFVVVENMSLCGNIFSLLANTDFFSQNI